jgi:hypothetical protein
MRPIYETACLLAQAWHGHHPSALTAADAVTLIHSLNALHLYGREHRSLGHKAGGGIASGRQLARRAMMTMRLIRLPALSVRRRYP